MTTGAIKAVIDVGTNSVKLLVARVEAGTLRPLDEQSQQTRLGRGFYETHLLLAEAIAQSAEAVGRFAALARERQASSIRVIATSAARDAVNRTQLIDKLQEASGLVVEIISGEEEAELVFRGVATDPALRDRKLLILDVGGGSTEFIAGEGGHHTFRQSFDIGTVRMLEKLRPGDPPSQQDLNNCRARMKEFLAERVGPALYSAVADSTGLTLVGTGGTTTILARMEKGLSTFARYEIEGTLIPFQRIRYWMDKLWATTVEERKRIIGVPANRADIIPMGVAIYEAVMELLEAPEVFVSTRGLRFGALMAHE